MAKPLNQLSGMPQMEVAFSGWSSTFVLQIVSQTIADGFVTDTTVTVTYNGTIQPLSPEQTALKPDGERSWEWLQIHVIAGQTNLVNNDRIVYNGKSFKVMSVKDYTLNNYVEYHVIADYEAA
tara:strand:- start:54 stop:422 length:369 start_codon:yes stop_codon:yes gene_type:complete